MLEQVGRCSAAAQQAEQTSVQAVLLKLCQRCCQRKYLGDV